MTIPYTPIIALLLIACSGPAPESNSGTLDSESQWAQEIVQFQFEPTDQERERLEEAVSSVMSRLEVGHLSASVSRFGDDPQRYFLFLIPPPRNRAGNVLFAAATVHGDSLSLSEVFDTNVPFGPGPGGLSVQSVTDIDNDDLPDVVYCAPAAESEGLAAHAVGFTGGAWYEIQDSEALRQVVCTSGR